MKKILLLTSILINTSLMSEDFIITLDKKNYENRIQIEEYQQDTNQSPPSGNIPQGNLGYIIGSSLSTLPASKMSDGNWNCNYSSGNGNTEVTFTFDKPYTFNNLTSAGMDRLWQGPLMFYAIVNNEEIALGNIKTSGYCGELVKETINFSKVTTDQIRIKVTHTRIYVDEIEINLN